MQGAIGKEGRGEGTGARGCYKKENAAGRLIIARVALLPSARANHEGLPSYLALFGWHRPSMLPLVVLPTPSSFPWGRSSFPPVQVPNNLPGRHAPAEATLDPEQWTPLRHVLYTRTILTWLGDISSQLHKTSTGAITKQENNFALGQLRSS